MGTTKRIAARKRAGKQWVAEAMCILAEWRPTAEELTRKCRTHGRDCPAFPKASCGRFHLEISGVCCQPWSLRGRRRGWLDERSLPCLVLVHQLLVALPHGICIECTPCFDFMTLAGLLEERYVGEFAVTCPSDLGLPLLRRRKYMWFDLRHSLHKVHFPLSQYADISRRARALDGSIYMRATDEEVQAYYAALLQKQQVRSCPLVPRRRVITLEDVLKGGYLQRFREHMEQVESLRTSQRGRCHFLDISQSVEFGHLNKSHCVPTLCRSSRLVYVPPLGRQPRLVLPQEMLAMHGIMLPATVEPRLKQSGTQMQQLIGNTMHVGQVGTFLQFAMSSRSVGRALHRQMPGAAF